MLINVDDDGNWRGWWCCDVDDDDDGDDDVVDGDMIMMMMMVMVMMVMLMKMLMMMMMKKITRGRWWCWYWGGGRWRCWGGRMLRRKDRSQDREAHFVRACAVPNVSQKPFCTETYRQNAGPVSADTHFVRACAVEMHMDMSQEAFCVKKIRENAGRYQYHVDWTPSVWPHCLGKEVSWHSKGHKGI